VRAERQEFLLGRHWLAQVGSHDSKHDFTQVRGQYKEAVSTRTHRPLDGRHPVAAAVGAESPTKCVCKWIRTRGKAGGLVHWACWNIAGQRRGRSFRSRSLQPRGSTARSKRRRWPVSRSTSKAACRCRCRPRTVRIGKVSPENRRRAWLRPLLRRSGICWTNAATVRRCRRAGSRMR